MIDHNNDPIPYQLLLLQAVTSFVSMKANLSPRYASIDYLIDAWGALVAWSNGAPAPTGGTAHPEVDAWLAVIVSMRRSSAARLDVTDPPDDGLNWLIDLCDLLSGIIARPGLELTQEELGDV